MFFTVVEIKQNNLTVICDYIIPETILITKIVNSWSFIVLCCPSQKTKKNHIHKNQVCLNQNTYNDRGSI